MEERDKDIITQKKAEDEIDLVEIIQKLWRNRKFILKVTAVFAVLGFIIAISTPNVYTASCTMVPQTGQKSPGGSLGGLAAMAGINLGSMSSGEILSPNVYPIIMTNINFQKELMYSKFHFQGIDKPISLYDYYTEKKYHKSSLVGLIKKYSIGLPGLIISSFKDSPNNSLQADNTALQSLTSREKSVIKYINSSLLLNVNNKDGYITISANTTEPLFSAELAQKGQELLQNYITEFKLEKVTINLEFITRSYEEAKKNFEIKQSELAKFRDSNKSLTSSVAKTQEEMLTSEYNLLLGIYTELAKQKEQAKIAITETTPLLTIIEPVVVPSEKSKPSRLIICIVFSFIGLIVGIVIVYIVPFLEENFISNIKKNWFIPKIV